MSQTRRHDCRLITFSQIDRGRLLPESGGGGGGGGGRSGGEKRGGG